MKNPRILVAEDEAIVAQNLKDTLHTYGYEVVSTVASGEDAISITGEEHPDLVLMDIVLHGDMDGVEAAAEIRSRFGIPVVYLTAYADDTTLKRAKVTGPYGYLVKPFEERELLVTLEVALQRAELEGKLKENERWLEAVLGSIGDAVVAVNMAGSITFMNKVAENLTGVAIEDAGGMLLEDVISVVDRAGNKSISDFFSAMISGNQIITATLPLLSVKGGEIMVNFSISPIQDSSNNVNGGVLVLRDITEQQKSDDAMKSLRWVLEQRMARRSKELHDKNTMLQNVIDAFKEPLYIIDVNNYKIELANRAAKAKFGNNEGSCHALLHSARDSKDKCPCPMEEVRRTREPVTVEHLHYDKDGTRKYLEVHGYPILDKNGEVAKMLEYSVDITKWKKTKK